jgi:hypothetical protein
MPPVAVYAHGIILPLHHLHESPWRGLVVMKFFERKRRGR